MQDVFVQLGMTLGVALIVSLIMKFLKQPLIIGYIITGIIVGPAVSGIVTESGLLESFSHLGIALLLFIVGLGLKPSVIKDVGKVATITGLAQILFTTLVGFFIAKIIGFTDLVAFYLALSFALSSTIIVLRILYNKGEQDTLNGRITIGFLLVQDVVAMLFFIILTATAQIGTANLGNTLLMLAAKLVLIAFGVYFLLKFIIPRIDKIFAENKEMLFIFALGICFAMASIFQKLGFSLELGALAAGVNLSVSPYQREIASRLQSLRDFFLIIFFVIMGANIDWQVVGDYKSLIIVFSLFILIFNPLILFLIMRLLGYTSKISFYTGLTVAQVSEFSLILITTGVGLGHLPDGILGPATVIAIVTMTVSTYFMSYDKKIFRFFAPLLRKIAPDLKRRRGEQLLAEKSEVILFGSHRLGAGLIKQLRQMKTSFLVIDHDPEVIKALSEKKIPCLYGSADDPDLIDELPLHACHLIISTIPELEINQILLQLINKKKHRINFICIANHNHDAEKMYQSGATYVIVPPYLGRRFIVDLVKKNGLDSKKYQEERGKHLFDLAYFHEHKYL